MTDNGYIYLRTNEAFDKYDAFHLGKTHNLHDADLEYKSNEIRRGKFIFVIKLENYELIEKKINIYFSRKGLCVCEGKTFYNKEIINLLPEYLNKLNVVYNILTEEEINNLLPKIKRKFDLKKMAEYIKSNPVGTI